jgi:hypothetical protein
MSIDPELLSSPVGIGCQLALMSTLFAGMVKVTVALFVNAISPRTVQPEKVRSLAVPA